MLEKLRVVFTIPELRQKIFLTLLLLAIYRVGWQIPLPMVNQEAAGKFKVMSPPEASAKTFSSPVTKRVVVAAFVTVVKEAEAVTVCHDAVVPLDFK